MLYIYTTQRNVGIQLPPSMLRGVKDFKSEWLKIDTQRKVIIVKKGYSWDGCTPKLFSILGLFWVGTPDGVPLGDGFRITGKASLMHDALYQYLGEHTMSRKQCDEVFKYQLGIDGFKLKWPYYAAVRTFGGLFNWYYRKFVK